MVLSALHCLHYSPFDRFESSALVHPVHGFGGNGVPGSYTLPPDPNGELEIPPFPCIPPAEVNWNGCVQTGPFRDTEFRVNVGPGRMMTDHCVTRNFNTACWGSHLTSAAVASNLLPTDYWTFSQTSDNGVHLGGHAIWGGAITNTFSSPAGTPFTPGSPKPCPCHLSRAHLGLFERVQQILCSIFTMLVWIVSGPPGKRLPRGVCQR